MTDIRRGILDPIITATRTASRGSLRQRHKLMGETQLEDLEFSLEPLAGMEPWHLPGDYTRVFQQLPNPNLVALFSYLVFHAIEKVTEEQNQRKTALTGTTFAQQPLTEALN